jgi:GreA/GreB family transcription elongation factor
MNGPAIRQASANQRWPMTGEAWLTLIDELGQLRTDVAAQVDAGVQEDGIAHLPVFKAARRLDVLSAVLDAAEKVHEADRAVIGRRVTLLEEEGDSVTYALVFPGDGDPVQGWISADSPLGSAVMGCASGDRVEVMAPAGPRVITVLSVD